MIIHGLQKTTLLDYPGRLAATVFTAACNLRCPFCHNAMLVTQLDAADRLDEGEVLGYLASRKKLLDGVCITGGEPTLQRELPDFVRAIKEIGLAVKLDTNGTNPAMLAQLLEAGLLDYVAMDFKNTYEKYPLTVGIPDFDVAPVRESVALLLGQTKIDYEFRTTVIEQFHTPDDIEEIAKALVGAPRYALQPFVDSGKLIGFGNGVTAPMSAPNADVLQEMLCRAKVYLPTAFVRGA